MANTTITVNVAESQNYLATSKTISVSSGTKQQGYINLSENSVTMTGQSGNLYYVNITSYSGGTLSVSSSNTSVVTATVYSPQSNPAIELTLVGSGNATITVTVGETSTYTSATATISVTANVVVDPVPDFETCTEAELITCINKYYNGEITLAQIQAKWQPGMTRKIASAYASDSLFVKYGSQNQQYMLMGMNVDTLTTPINGKTKALITLVLTEVVIQQATTTDTTYCHYYESPLRNQLNTTCKNSYTNVGAYIKQVNKTTEVNWGQSTSRSTTHSDYVWVASYQELISNAASGGEVVYPAKPTITTGRVWTRSSYDPVTSVHPNIRYAYRTNNTIGRDVWDVRSEVRLCFCL